MKRPFHDGDGLNGLDESFDLRVIERGKDCFFRGAVSIEFGNETRVDAEVKGTYIYDVMLLRRKNTIFAACECPFFLKNEEPCKHMYAVLLACLRNGALDLVEDLNRGKRLSLFAAPGMMGEFGYDEDDEDDDMDDYLEEDDGLLNPLTFWRDEPSLLDYPEPALLDGDDEPSSIHPAMCGRDLLRIHEILYLLDIDRIFRTGCLVLTLGVTRVRKDGNPGEMRIPALMGQSDLTILPDSRDAMAVNMLCGAGSHDSFRSNTREMVFVLDPWQVEHFMPLVCGTGKCRLMRSGKSISTDTVSYDGGSCWSFQLEVSGPGDDAYYEVTGSLILNGARRDLSEPAILLNSGWIVWDDRIARLEHHGLFKWIVILRKERMIRIPQTESTELIRELLSGDHVPDLVLPESLSFETEAHVPTPVALIALEKNLYGAADYALDVKFDYDGELVESGAGYVIRDGPPMRVIERDSESESRALEQVEDLNLDLTYSSKTGKSRRAMNKNGFRDIVACLLDKGWRVEAEGKPVRAPGVFNLSVTSGVDWFDLRASCDYGDTEVLFPFLLEAARRGEEFVVLGDGSFGMLPEKWLARYGDIAEVGELTSEGVRFKTCQAVILDALLRSQPEHSCDEVFENVRRELAGFSGVEPTDEPRGFFGALRPYQKDGLGWMQFLRRLGLGGCLADDMGLGKTVQLLALLVACSVEKQQEEQALPSLVVCPRSVLFNWMKEADRFAPGLNKLDYTGPKRKSAVLQDYDLVLTTYGTLRRDIVSIKDIRFDYVVLDESQAIKNPATAAAKAVRLLQADRRLALSGTPIENHVGELWSLFEFLNPGMLGRASVFTKNMSDNSSLSEEKRSVLARALRPFILRRTKADVASDLPDKVEETQYCELKGSQKRLYDEIAAYYRARLLKKDQDDLKRMKIQVLEALLRLRQAACHPALIDHGRKRASSAKLDSLVPQLLEIAEEGHKTLVFSQFTSLLHILQPMLEKQGMVYEYLDGGTRNRAACVERFQNDDDCKVFLISLKAGGLGLNLTAAEYVFLLDPWWNPAVESQAIDRAHRIGQARTVFAYRIIARDTVEEKVLQLQNSKRELADAILRQDNSLIRDLKPEDLELLLS